MSTILHASTRMSSGILSVSALLLLVCVYETVATVDHIVIDQAPRSQRVLISENATFYCSGRADNVNWAIENNGTHLDTLTDDEREARGIVTGGPYISPTEYNNSLTILGTEENNQTMIKCVFVSSDARNDTSTAILTVWGPPAPPHLTLELLNATTIQLTWTPPFTWPGFPIQNYTVRMENTSNSMGTREWNIPANENNSNDSVTFDLSTMNGEIASGCALLNFHVTAWSDLGESSPGSISGGFPIIPQIGPTDVITPRTSFQRNASPLINIRFQAPRACPFQTANYTILIERVGTNETIKIGPVQYSYQSPFTVEIWVNSSLVVDAEYSITATFSSLASSVSLPNVTVCTDFSPPTAVTPNTTAVDLRPTDISITIPVIVGAAMGAVAVLVLIVIFVMCALMCLHCFRKKAKPATCTLTTYQGAPPTPMSLNPLYEGSGTDESLEHYENLDPYLVDEHQVTGPVLCHPGPPIVPPPRNGTDANAWLPSGKSLEQLSTSNEQYTVMTSAGTVVNMEINEGPITYTNDAERYVINDPK